MSLSGPQSVLIRASRYPSLPEFHGQGHPTVVPLGGNGRALCHSFALGPIHVKVVERVARRKAACRHLDKSPGLLAKQAMQHTLTDFCLDTRRPADVPSGLDIARRSRPNNRLTLQITRNHRCLWKAVSTDRASGHITKMNAAHLCTKPTPQRNVLHPCRPTSSCLVNNVTFARLHARAMEAAQHKNSLAFLRPPRHQGGPCPAPACRRNLLIPKPMSDLSQSTQPSPAPDLSAHTPMMQRHPAPL